MTRHTSVPTPSGMTRRVPRPSLHKLGERAARSPVCVVVAAAGWGKSTTVGSWARGQQAAWVRFSSHCGDPGEFTRCLRGALRRHLPVGAGDGPEPGVVGDAGTRYSAMLGAWLRMWLCHSVVLVVDDLHELEPRSEPVQLLEGLCRHVPDQLHVVLISRRPPPFSLTRLRGQGMVSEIRASDLALDEGEITTVLSGRRGEHPDGLVEQVRERTAGWPTAVLRAADTLEDVDPEHQQAALDRLTDPGGLLHTYLAEEVIATEPEPVRALLRRLAVFGEASADLAAPGNEGAAMLADLTARGLTERIPGHVDRWSLVQPLHDYYTHDPELDPTARSDLHRSAARECDARGAHAQALRHLLAAGEHTACADLLLEHGETLVRGGGIDVVLEAARLAPESLTDPRLQRVIGQASQVRGQWDSALACFRRAGTDEEALTPALAWRIGLIAFTRGAFQDVPPLLERACLGLGELRDQARLFALAATTSRLTGNIERCRVEVDRALTAAGETTDPCAQAAALTALAVLVAGEGDYARSNQHCVAALDAADAGTDVLQVLRLRVLRAINLVELGQARDGLVEAEAALKLGGSCGDPFLTALALIARGRANMRSGALDSALTDFGVARDTLRRIGSGFLSWALCGLGDLHRLRGQLARGRAAYEEALEGAEAGHDVLALSWSLIGLARVRAADDVEEARHLADRAVALDDGPRRVEALLTRGWVAVMASDRDAAVADTAAAGEAARRRRDNTGLAEALVLGVLCEPEPGRHASPLAEAIEIFQDAGRRLDAAAYRVVADRVGAQLPGLPAGPAEAALRDCGVEIEPRGVAGPLAVAVGLGPSVLIRSLGVFEVLRDGDPIPSSAWQSRKARDLLKILVAHRRPVAREKLMEWLWPDSDPARAANRLSVVLSTLRDVLRSPSRDKPMPLVTDGEVVGLDRARVTVDVERFLIDTGTALEAHRLDADDATARLVAAEAEHTGAFLEGEPYQEWAASLVEDVRAAYVAVLRALTARLRDEGDVDGTVRYMLKLLEQDSYDEQAHLDLLRTHLEAGHHGEGRRRYQIYVDRMNDLGVEPRAFPVRRTRPAPPSHRPGPGSRRHPRSRSTPPNPQA